MPLQDALMKFTATICTGDEFDKLSDHIYRLIEKVIYRCLGNLRETRKRLQAEGLEAYLDLYLELQSYTS